MHMSSDEDDYKWEAEDLLGHVVPKADWDLADQLFEHIEYEDQAEYLVQDYWNLKKWPQRVILAYLLQAQPGHDDEIVPQDLWFDVLRAPVPGEWDDHTDFTMMTALAHLAERYDTFQRFYDDRELLHRTVDEVLSMHDATVEPSPGSRRTSEEPAPEDDPVSALERAVERGDLPALHALLDAGIDIDCPISDRRSWAPLSVPVFLLAQLDSQGQPDIHHSPLVLAALRDTNRWWRH